MSKLYKVFSFVLILAFALAACGPSNTAEEPVVEEPAVEEPAVEEPEPTAMPEMSEEEMMAEEMMNNLGVSYADLDGVEIEFWHVWDRAVGDALQAIVDDFNANNMYGITVVALNQGSYGDIFTNMNAAINTGETPDLVVGYNNQYLSWDSAGDVIVDMNTYINDPYVGLSADEIADFYTTFWEQDDINGERLGLPAQRSGQMMFYNLTWAQELGFDAPPSTPEEFKEQACAAAAANGDGTGGWFLDSGASTIAGWVFAFGGNLEAEGGGYSFNTPEAQAALEFLHGLFADGCAWRPEARFPNPEFATRLGLFFTSSVAGIPFQLSAMEEAGSTDEWTAIAFPSVSGDPSLNVYGPSIAMVESTPAEQLAAWLFIKYFSESENQAAWISASGYFPTRASTVPLLEAYAADNPQWANAYSFLPYGKFEPRYESWSSVRGAIGDAAAQLFQEGFDPTTIPDLLATLQATADELHAETQP